MIKALSLAAVAAITVTSIAACSAASLPAHGHAVAPSTPTTPPATPGTATSCLDRAISWRDDGGSANMNALLSALTHDTAAFAASSKDMGAGNPTGVASVLSPAAAHLLSAAQAAQADPPPSCFADMRTNFEKALSDVIQSAESQQSSVMALNDGDYETATADIEAAGSDFTTGLKPLDVLTKDFGKLDKQ